MLTKKNEKKTCLIVYMKHHLSQEQNFHNLISDNKILYLKITDTFYTKLLLNYYQAFFIYPVR